MKAQPFSKTCPQQLLIELRNSFFAWVVPVETYKMSIEDGHICANGSKLYPLPPGNWQIVCTSKECTEDDAVKIVEGNHNAYIDYEREFGGIRLRMFTAIESLHSLLRSKGCDTDKGTFLILKQL